MSRFGWGGDQWFDDNGKPLSRGKLYFYETGTSTAKTTYSNAALSVPNTNPVILDAEGRQGPVFFSGAARLVIQSAAGVQIDDPDPVYPVESSSTVVVGDEAGITVENMAALLLVEGDVDDAICTMLGYTTASDGGGGVWYWDSASTATVNAGTVVKPTATVGAGRWLRIFEPGTVNVKWFGAFCNGVADDTTAVDAANAAVSTGGTVIFPYGEQNFTFTQPDYGVTWEFSGPEVTRAQLGGTSSAVRFVKPDLYYLPGPHPTDQLQAKHLRVIAQGSDEIGAQYGDYALGITIEKENWSESSGSPVAGEINAMTIFLRNGRVTGDPVKTGGSAILANIGNTEGSGDVQLLESVNSLFEKGTLAAIQQTRLQMQILDDVTGSSYMFNCISETGEQSGVFRIQGTTAAPWGLILQNFKDSVQTFRIRDDGRIAWRNTDSIESAVEIEETTGDLIFKNATDEEMLRVRQTGYTPRFTSGTSESITGYDHERLVSFANVSPITCELSNAAPRGTRVYALQREVGTITFVPEAGAIFRNVDKDVATTRQWSIVTLQVSNNSDGASAIWYLVGDTEEAGSPRVVTGTTDTLLATDNFRIVSFANSSPITCELPADAPGGTTIRCLQRDAGQVTFVAGSGATLRNRSSHTKTAGQWAMVTLEVGNANATKDAAVWYLSGDTAA